MPLPNTADMVRSLRSDLCPMCGGSKKPKQTMCITDYSRLPRQLKRRLYSYVGQGYEGAVEEAMQCLGVEEFRVPEASKLENA